MLVVEHDVRRAVAYGAGGFGFVFVVVNLELGEVGLDFSVSGLRVEVEAGFVGHAQIDIAVAAVDLHVAERAHGDFDAAVLILHTHIAGNIFEANFFGARGQVHGAGDLVGVEVVGIQIEIAIDAGELQVGAGRFEGDAFADAGKLDALLEFAVELGGAL